MRKLLSLSVLLTATVLSVATSEKTPPTSVVRAPRAPIEIVVRATRDLSVAATLTEAGWQLEVRVADDAVTPD